jgi:hypothetical protein
MPYKNRKKGNAARRAKYWAVTRADRLAKKAEQRAEILKGLKCKFCGGKPLPTNGYGTFTRVCASCRHVRHLSASARYKARHPNKYNPSATHCATCGDRLRKQRSTYCRPCRAKRDPLRVTAWHRENVANISDRYVGLLLGLKVIPPRLAEVKRLQITIHRMTRTT